MKQKYPNGLAEALASKPGATQEWLAGEVGTSQQQIGKLLHGQRKMSVEWAEKLSHVLGVPPEVLIFPGLRRTRIPVYSWVSAGRMALPDGVHKVDATKFVMTGGLPKGDWFVLQVEGDSMNRVAPDTSYIFVNRADQRLVDDELYVFSTPEGEATFKRYRNGKPPRLQPFSTNPDHETIIPTGEIQVLGRVGRVMLDLF